MKRMSLWLLVSIFVVSAWVVQAQDVVTEQPTTQGVSEKVIPKDTDGISPNGECSLCFTCGGCYPIFAGAFRSMGDNPIERGSSCANPLQARGDQLPNLCCKDKNRLEDPVGCGI